MLHLRSNSRPAPIRAWPLLVPLLAAACSDTTSGDGAPSEPEPEELNWPCEIADGTDTPDYLTRVGCRADFEKLGAQPTDASIPGALSGKVIVDQCPEGTLGCDGDKLYFQNTDKFAIHYEFAKAYLDEMSALRAVGSLSDFNPVYTEPEATRRFLLGSVTHYEGPNVWALEIAPYDTSTPAMVEKLYHLVREASFYGPVLRFHPTSENLERTALQLASDVPVTTNDELFAGIDYQPLNQGEVVGPIKFLRSVDLEEVYVSSRDIVVLDAVPNDIAPVAGIVTEEFQTPLSHINVLSRNRGTPNMGLKNARQHPKFAALEDGQNVRLTVGAFGWDIVPATLEETETYWAEHPFPVVTVPKPDLSVTDLRDIELVTEHTDTAPYVTLEAIQNATRQFGAKAANYSVFSTDAEIPQKDAFAIPVYYYDQFMTDNGIFARIDELGADPRFLEDESVRDAELAAVREQVMAGEFEPAFQELLRDKLEEKYPGRSIRFRSSTNAEDLNGFPCAGCYDSHTGDPEEFGGDQLAAALDAIKRTWATVWNLRTYDERRIHEIVHRDVCMALLVHTNFPDEEANGVAVTNNIFDTSGNAPGFYVNVQRGGEAEVVHPPPGITSDSFLYQFTFAGQPVIYYSHSNLIPEGETVLTPRQIYDLGVSLERLHRRFSNAYQASPTAWYGLDVEFKFDDEADPGGEPTLYIKQARPYPPPPQ
jgi:pyruvate,water dikinase